MQAGLSRRQKKQVAQARDDARAVMQHPPTMRFLLRILDECGYYRDQMTGDNATFYALGQRKTGMQIVDALAAVDPDALLKLLQTAASNRRRDAPEPEDENDDI